MTDSPSTSNSKSFPDMVNRMPEELKRHVCVLEPCMFGQCVRNLSRPVAYICVCFPGSSGEHCENGSSLFCCFCSLSLSCYHLLSFTVVVMTTMLSCLLLLNTVRMVRLSSVASFHLNLFVNIVDQSIQFDIVKNNA